MQNYTGRCRINSRFEFLQMGRAFFPPRHHGIQIQTDAGRQPANPPGRAAHPLSSERKLWNGRNARHGPGHPVGVRPHLRSPPIPRLPVFLVRRLALQRGHLDAERRPGVACHPTHGLLLLGRDGWLRSRTPCTVSGTARGIAGGPGGPPTAPPRGPNVGDAPCIPVGLQDPDRPARSREPGGHDLGPGGGLSHRRRHGALFPGLASHDPGPRAPAGLAQRRVPELGAVPRRPPGGSRHCRGPHGAIRDRLGLLGQCREFPGCIMGPLRDPPAAGHCAKP